MATITPVVEEPTFWQRVKDVFWENWGTIKWFVIVLAIVIGAALFAIWNAQRTQKFSTEELNGIQKLINFAAKSAREAQKTQSNTLQSLLHVNYGICFINAAKHMVGSMDTLQNLSPININEMYQFLTQTQIHLLNRIRQQCVENATRNDLLGANNLVGGNNAVGGNNEESLQAHENE